MGEAERLRAAERRHAQRVERAERPRIVRREAREQAGGARFREQVECAHARRAIGAERDVDARGAQRGHRADATAESLVRLWAVHDRNAGACGEVDVVVGEPVHVHGAEPGTQQPLVTEPGKRALTVGREAVLHLGLRLVQVHRERRVELIDQATQPREGFALHGIRRVRREAGQDQRVVAILVPQPRGLVEVFVDVGRPRRAAVDDRRADHHPQVVRAREARDFLGKEIHVGEAGDACREHLAHRKLRAAPHELRVHATALDGPDRLVEPLHQRAADRKAAQQAHGRMGVRVDESRQDRVMRPCDALTRREARGECRGGPDRDDPPAIDGERRVLERGVAVHGQRPAGLDEKVDRLHPENYIGDVPCAPRK